MKENQEIKNRVSLLLLVSLFSLCNKKNTTQTQAINQSRNHTKQEIKKEKPRTQAVNPKVNPVANLSNKPTNLGANSRTHETRRRNPQT